jgi:peptidoglycan/xylan/chitin deacetylase (PgdA/CDA1 family)
LDIGVKALIVTSSWDDGHKYDLRLAQMLQQYGLKATFYVSPRNREWAQGDLLTQGEINEIGKDFEIGSHTVTHPRLPTISQSQAREEIVGSKSMLEDITGQAILSFCYPGGAYTSAHPHLVREAGYQFARTVVRYASSIEEPYEAPTSLHAHNHWGSDIWKIAELAKFKPIAIARYREWDSLGRAMFDRIARAGGVFHIWGHSWEIDQHNGWERLEGMFRYLSARPGVKYVTNGELV